MILLRNVIMYRKESNNFLDNLGRVNMCIHEVGTSFKDEWLFYFLLMHWYQDLGYAFQSRMSHSS